MTTSEQMIKKARAIMANAYSPYSNFRVGACFEAEDGSLYCGCNVENASYGGTLCAEAGALASLIGAGHQKIKAVALTSTGDEPVVPCGICLQRISEFAESTVPIYICDQEGQIYTYTLKDLFPQSFNLNHMRGHHDN